MEEMKAEAERASVVAGSESTWERAAVEWVVEVGPARVAVALGAEADQAQAAVGSAAEAVRVQAAVESAADMDRAQAAEPTPARPPPRACFNMAPARGSAHPDPMFRAVVPAVRMTQVDSHRGGAKRTRTSSEF